MAKNEQKLRFENSLKREVTRELECKQKPKRRENSIYLGEFSKDEFWEIGDEPWNVTNDENNHNDDGNSC